MTAQDFGFHIAHIGINAENDAAALAAAKTLEAFFGFSYSIGLSSIFSADRTVELMKKPFRGKNGHIAVGTTDIDGAVAWLRASGVSFAEETAVRKDGQLAAIYLADEIAGFAVHLLGTQKSQGVQNV